MVRPNRVLWQCDNQYSKPRFKKRVLRHCNYLINICGPTEVVGISFFSWQIRSTRPITKLAIEEERFVDETIKA